MKAKSIIKRVLSTVLVMVMLFSCWVFTAPSASAATAGNYTVVVKFNVTDSCGSKYTEDNYITITYKSNNGTGSESTKTWDLDSIVTSGGEKTVSATLGGYPTKVKLNVNNKQASAWTPWDRDGVKVKVHTVTVQGTAVWTGTIELESDVLEHSETKDIGNSPYAASITAISGDATAYVNTNGTTTNTYSYSLGTVKDQYGVNWYQDASWDTATVSNGVSFSSGTLTVPASSNRASNYTVTLKEKCGNASNTKTVTVSVFKYQVTFYDENGTTVLKSKQDVAYGGNATAPSSPSKAYDDSKHYTFNTWTGDTYQNITSGKQVKTVKASYTGTTHTYNQTSVHVDSGTGKTLKTAATCTDAAVYYNTCICGKVGSTNTHSHGSALGHNWTKKTINADTLYQAATCDNAARYYYSCSRCDAIASSDEYVFSDGSPLGHDWSDWVDDANETAELGSGTHTATCYNDGTHTKTEAHNYSAWQIIPSNDSEGIHTSHDRLSEHFRVCNSENKGCGKIEYTTHKWVVDEVVAPTCTDRGYTTYHCSDCNMSATNRNLNPDIDYSQEGVSDDIAPLSHDWGDWTDISDSQHKRICNNDENHIETGSHNMTTWQNKIPDGDDHAATTARNTINAAISAGTYDSKLQHFRYCTVCGRVEFYDHDQEYFIGEETTPATCTEKGVTTYTCSACGESYTDANIPAKGHSWGDVKSAQAEDNTPGYTYYECENCHEFCPAAIDEGTYVPNPGENNENVVEVESSVEANTVSIPDPLFNDGGSTARFYDGIDYSTRPASFRYDTSEDSQTIRFAGSVKVPAGVSWQVGTQSDNVVTDFGFVYTQTKYICDYNSNTGKYIDGSNPNPSKLYYDASKIAAKGETGYKIYQMSVFDNSGEINHIYNGFSHHQVSSTGGTADYLTFNLVIGVNVGNWAKEYAARPYITYKYNGLTYTVYDGGVSNIDEKMKYSHRSVTDLAEDIMYFDPFDEEFAKSMKYDYRLDYNGYKALVLNYKEDKAYALNRYFESRMDKAAFEALVAEKINSDPWWTLATDIEELLDNPEWYDVNWYNNEI